MTDTITSETTVETVTFFEDRAEVVRVARVRCPAGRCRIRALGVTLLVDDRSLKVTSAARVLAARVRRIAEPRASASAEQVAELEQQLTRVSGELAGELAARTRAEVAVRRSANLLATWSGVAASVPSRTEEAVRELTDAYAALDGDERAAFERMAAAREEAERLERARAHLAARLAAARTVTPRYEAIVEIDVESDAEGEVSLVIDYRTPCALWRPEHRARLVRNDDGTFAMSIVTLATAWQATGETWRDVQCRFSTARPARSAVVPLLHDDVLTVRPKDDLERKRIVASAREQTIATTGSAHGTRDVSAMPGVEDGGEAMWLNARAPATVTSDGRPCRVEIGERTLPCNVALVAWPELAGAAHVRAVGTLPGPGPLLAGPVVVMRGTEVVGRGKVKFTGAGEALELGFGVDDGIRVRRRTTEKTKTTPVIGTQHIEREVVVYVSNLARTARRVSIIERVPVSEIEDLTIEVEPRRDMTYDARDGFVTLAADLGPNATAELVLRYRIEASSNVVLPTSW
ncbi:MAG TPA: mucoidy inhibitor MuiA family protein [Labilithrix sp.]|nr:mucoidy inhibitor MuiA family protein [Labilithrix sp.]